MKKEKIIVIVITIILLIFNIFISYHFYKNEQEEYKNHVLKLLSYENNQNNNYKLKESIQIKISDNNIVISNQNIVENIDSNIIGFKYSLDGINYTSTIDLNEIYTFKHVKNIENISNVYVKVIQQNYNEVMTCKYVTDSYKYIPDVKIEVSTNEYTNDGVYVVIKGNDILNNNYELQYKINDEEFIKYDKSFKIEKNNTKITAVIYNKKENKIEKETEYTINNIDKESPTCPQKVDGYIEDNMLYIKAIGSIDKESGILGFKYKVNDGDISDFIIQNEYYIYEIKEEKEFNIQIIAIDNVLNESEKYEKKYTLNELTK